MIRSPTQGRGRRNYPFDAAVYAGRTLTHRLAYQWTAGQLSAVVTPAGRTIHYRRDGAGRISDVQLSDPSSGGQTRPIASQITYHPLSGVKSYLDGAGQVHARTQDQDGLTSSYTLGAQTWQLGRNNAGLITAQFDSAHAATSALYGYDALDRLSSVHLPTISYGYTWDATGNRSGHTLGARSDVYVTAASSNRLQSVSSTPVKTYSHDATGSLTGDGVSRSFGYDSQGRLSQATTAAGVTRYQYNALGERVRKTTGSADTVYHYDRSGRLLTESRADGTIAREYLWLDDTPLAVLQ